ncbi:5174_t:CDS:1, partial [Acaulospora morrowiae]
LTLPFIYGTPEGLQEFLSTNEMVMIYASKPPMDVLPGPRFIRKSDRIITSEQTERDDMIKTSLKFWHSGNKEREMRFPTRLALFLSDAYSPKSFDDVLKIGVDGKNMNVPAAGSVLMWELNRIIGNIRNENDLQN